MQQVLYIAGFGRSGSTLLESLLRTHFQAFGVGEVFFIWDRGFIKNELCGCGKTFHECGFWPEVIRDAFGTVHPKDAQEFQRVFQSWQGQRPHLLGMQGQIAKNLYDFKAIAKPLYASIHRVSKQSTVIDSSKYPLYYMGLNQSVDSQTNMIHLFRDPRAVAFSWQRKKQRLATHKPIEKPDYMYRAATYFGSVRLWHWFNAQAQKSQRIHNGRYALCSYDRLCNNTDDTLLALKTCFDLHPKSKAIHTGNTHAWHTLSGNPARMGTGLATIQKDDAWQGAMPALYQHMIGWLCQVRYRALQNKEKQQVSDLLQQAFVTN